MRFVDEHYMEDITLKQLAGEFYVDLSKLFKSFTQMRYIDYITYKRIQKAKSLLRDTDLAIYQIANMLNYRDAKYFSNLFKKIEGVTPRQYCIQE